MALNLLIRPIRTISQPIVRTEIRSLFTTYYMTNPKHKVGTDHLNQSFSPSDYIIEPVPIGNSASVPYANPRRFATSAGDQGMWQGLKKQVGLATGLGYRYPKYRMTRSSLNLFLCCTELVQFDDLFDYLDLPDTFVSYFNLLYIHVWLVLCRIAQEGEEGRFIKKAVLTSLWDDMTQRLKRISPVGGIKNRHESLQEIYGQSVAALFAYDEGALGDDKALAGALWRILFQKDCDEPQKLAKMVHYVRKQQAFLDRQDSHTLMYHGVAFFLPFDGEVLDYEASLGQIKVVLLGRDLGKKTFIDIVSDPNAPKLLAALPKHPFAPISQEEGERVEEQRKQLTAEKLKRLSK